MIKAEIDSINYLIGKYEYKPHKPAKGTLCYSIQNNEIVYYLQNSIYEDGKRKRTAIMLGDIYSKPVQSIKLNRFNYEMLKRLRTNKKLLAKSTVSTWTSLLSLCTRICPVHTRICQRNVILMTAMRN